MGIDAVITAIIALAGSAGGYLGGRKMGIQQSVQIANETVNMLRIQVNTLREGEQSKTAVITDLRARIEHLEDMVTQRAKVDEVYTEVQGVRIVVDRIEDKIDGTS